MTHNDKIIKRCCVAALYEMCLNGHPVKGRLAVVWISNIPFDVWPCKLPHYLFYDLKSIAIFQQNTHKKN